MSKYEVGDRVEVNQDASDSYWGMTGTIAEVGPEDTYRVDMDFVPSEKRRLSLADSKGWRFSGHMLDPLCEKIAPALENTLALLEEWEALSEESYALADSMSKHGSIAVANSLYEEGYSGQLRADALRTALESDGITLPAPKE